MNDDTLASLQILYTEPSPNTHSQGPFKGASGGKEGLSIYGLFHHLALTSQGRQLLRQNFARPTLDLEVINERLESISIFLRPDNESGLKTITMNLGFIKNMRNILIQLKKGISSAPKKSGMRHSVWSNIRLVILWGLLFENEHTHTN